MLVRPIQACVASFFITLTVCDNIVTVAVVSGESMCPTLNPVERRFSDLVLVRKLGINSLKTGDLITLTSPRDPKETLVKRITGVEGEYIRTRSYKTRYLTVPRGHVWVEGDNANRSVDSNVYGPVSQGLITGKLLCVLWPSFRLLNNS
ncbi:Mitochondrial inner membrane protease subunit 2 isoform X4 [Oopsacas minuta]|uniref:Mitochondrial inner membrane protease subunit 2 n=1 Tax=Oopsacas minuta TaxID=111878 RepID=A0AAV7KHS4_9METZ|nr:Mitochondrial inner membrane protease subunit 2 isoform X4 [Oopsacas minuta]